MHEYRFNALVLKHWEEVIESIDLTPGEECDITLQLVLDRCLKSLIDSYNKHLHAQKKDVCTAMLTMQEHNAIRYMHGWIRCISVEEKVHQEGHQSFAKENAIVCEGA